MAWTGVGTGIEYQQFTLPAPNNVFVARMERNNPLCFIDTSTASNRVDGFREVISGQAARNDDALAFWGQDWGRRSDVVVAINGDYWNTSTYIPLGPQIQGGWLIRTITGTNWCWTSERRSLLGYGTWYDRRVRYATGVTQFIARTNVERGSNELTLYTNHYSANSQTDNTGVEVLVEMARPAMALPSNDGALGIIRQVRVNQGSTPIPFDHVVLSATGAAATTLQQNATVGSSIHIYDVMSSSFLRWSRAYGAVGGIGLLSSAAESTETLYQPMGGVIAPRTAIASNQDYIYFLVVDGRSSQSLGMDFLELADFCRFTLGAETAISCDGGGSSCMVVNGVVKNKPSDGTERSVPNGVLMCVMQPKLQSTSFNVADTIRTTGTTTLRSGPGSNYLSFGSLTPNTTGTIINHSLRGVYAKGSYWWNCDFGGSTGWVAQTSLTRTATGTGPTFTLHPVDATVCPTAATTTFQVAATGTGAVSYQWQHHGEDLSDNGHFTGTKTDTLTIHDANDPDVGAYRCIVTDSNASVTSYSAALFLKRHTLIDAHPEPVVARPLAGPQTVHFTVEARGEGTLSYRWQKGTTDLADTGHFQGTNTPTLTIQNVSSPDAADYRCRVSTICETAYSSPATLTVFSGDLDGDGDGDLDDFAGLQDCLGVFDPALNAPECVSSDLDGDERVNTYDITLFRNCLSGPDIPLPPGC